MSGHLSNLLEETIAVLAQHGHTLDDIKFCKVDGQIFTVGTFKKLADRVYDDSYGTHYVDLTLKLVGDNFWLERHEYDGSEWWEFKSPPVMSEMITDEPKIFVEY